MKQNKNDQIQKLKQENQRLTVQLQQCVGWIRREIAEKAFLINRRNAHDDTRSQMRLDDYEQIANMIESYFGQLLFMPGMGEAVPHLIDAEENFYHFMKKKEFDGFVVVNGYQKSFEALIETNITQGYRSFARKIKSNLRVNNLLEKTLHKVVTKGYMLSIGKFFESVEKLRNKQIQGEYEKAFSNYLKKNGQIGAYVVSDEFFHHWRPLIEQEVFGSRRHHGSISKNEVIELRTCITGNYDDPSGLLYQFIQATRDIPR